MSKFNKKSNVLVQNNEGHDAYKMELKDRLSVEVMTTFFGENKFYGDNSSHIVDDIREVCKKDPMFIANLAIYARREMHLRSISHILAAELAHDINGKAYARKVIYEVVERVDDMSEILSYYIEQFGKPIPNSMKKAMADKLLTFSEYSLAKYSGDSKDVKIKDIICLVHPKAQSTEQSQVFKRALENQLKTPETWETQLSHKGNSREVWESLIENNRLGYMALLRNLRNVLKCQPYNVEKVYEILQNQEQIKKSKQLPFRFYSAYRALIDEKLGTSKVYNALENAIRCSVDNMEKFKGKTFISADVSGSMTMPISAKSNVSSADIAILIMAMANYICEESITSTFDYGFYLNPMSSKGGIIANAKSIPINGGGTNISLPLKYLIKNSIYVDRIILLSDNEINRDFGNEEEEVQGVSNGYRYRGEQKICQKYINEYREKINPHVWVHCIDMQGYGTQQFRGERVNVIAGWNERVLEFISAVERGTETLKSKIESYYFKVEDCKNENCTW